jgi:hypothetical protein
MLFQAQDNFSGIGAKALDSVQVVRDLFLDMRSRPLSEMSIGTNLDFFD